jgi:DNA-binding protein H-NS
MSQQLGLFDAPAPAPMPRPVDLPPVTGGRPVVAFRNPANEHQAWTGRGKPPRWVTEWVQSGKSLEALRVPGARP